MKKEIYSIKDTLSGSFNQLIVQLNEALALRDIREYVNDVRYGHLYSNTKDFDIYRLGSVDTDTGIIESSVDFICHCLDLKDDVKNV